MKQWGKDRLNSLVDNLIWVVVGVVAVTSLGTLAALWAWGNDEARLPIWAVVLFGAVQLGTVLAVGVLFLRVSKSPHEPQVVQAEEITIERVAEPPRHPHQALLDQIDAVLDSVQTREDTFPISWPVATAFNELLAQCKNATGSSTLYGIDDLQNDPNGSGYAYSGDLGTLKTLLAQMRAIVKNHRQ